MELQVCSICGEEKEITEFPKNGKDKEGRTRYRTDCKQCYNINRKIKLNKHKKFMNNTKHRTGEDQTLSVDDWKDAMIYFRGTCAYCGKEQSRKLKLTKEHVVPVSCGGATVKSNIIPACTSCNCSKGNTPLIEWYQKQRFFDKARLEKIKRWQENGI